MAKDVYEPLLAFVEKVTRVKHENTESEYKRTLTRYHLTLFGLGNTIGAGIFALSGIAVQYTGPSLFLSFMIGGVMCLSTAFMYAELMSRYPTNGSAFGFFYATFGELPAWLVGWYLLPRYGAVSAALARAMTSYLAGLLAKFGISFPTILSSATLFGIDECCPMAVVFLYILCGINCLGSKESQLFNTVLTISKIGTLILIIIVGFTRFQFSNFQPFFNAEYGVEGTVIAASIVFFGVMGFDFISTLSCEAINPVQDIPASMRDSVIISTGFYMIVAIAVCGMGVGREPGFNPETAIADQFNTIGLGWMSLVIYICGLFGITAVAFTCLMGFVRLVAAYASDGLLPKIFSEVHQSTGVPVKGSLILTTLLVPLAFFQSLEQISKLISLSQLIIYSFVSVCSLYVRYSLKVGVFMDMHNRSSEHQVLNHAWDYKLIQDGRFIIWVYTFACFVSTSSFVNGFPLWWSSFTALLTAILFILLCRCPQPNKPDRHDRGYTAPWVPVLPALSIYFNFFLCHQLDGSTWLNLLIYAAGGLGIYFCYGVKNSKVQNN